MEKINEYLIPYHWGWDGFYKEVYERPVRLILPEFKKSDVVLDVGCGDGRLTSLIASRAKKVIGVDHQEYPLKFGRLIFEKLKIKNAIFKARDMTQLKFKDESFDKVACFDVIEHIPREIAAKGIKEMARVLKVGGSFYLTTPNRRELRGRIFGHKIVDKHYYEYSVREMKRLLSPYLKNIKVVGYYLPLPIPRAEHVANIIVCRALFRFLIKLGYNFPELSAGMLVKATKL